MTAISRLPTSFPPLWARRPLALRYQVLIWRSEPQSNLEVDALPELAKTRCSIGAAIWRT